MNRITLAAAALLLSSATASAAAAGLDQPSELLDPFCAKPDVVTDGHHMQITFDCWVPKLAMTAPVEIQTTKKAGGPDRVVPFTPPVKAGPVHDSVRLYPNPENTKANVDVMIAGQPVRMLLDTGASAC